MELGKQPIEPVEKMIIPADSVPGKVIDALSRALVARQQRGVRRHIEGDVHMGTPGVDARRVPGQDTPEGRAQITASTNRALERVAISVDLRNRQN